MTRPAGRVVAVVIAALLMTLGAAACADGTSESNCRRYLKLFDDVQEGRVKDGRELGRRLLGDLGRFPSGTDLRASYDRLVDHIEAGDEQKVAEEMAALADRCREVVAPAGS